MARDGSGNYELPAGNPVTPGTTIESTWANDTMADLGQALTQSIANDGQTLPVANLPMNGFRHTGVGDATLRTQYASLGQVQDGKPGRISITGGAPNNLTGTVIGQMSAYAPGALFSFQAPADSTGTVTLNINGIGARNIVTPSGTQLVSGDLKTAVNYLVMFDGAAFRLVTDPSSTGAVLENLEQNCISGWDRPASGVYPSIVVVNSTTVRVPSGRGRIIPPGEAGVLEVVEVVWSEQEIAIANLNVASTTILAVDATGVVQQFPGSPTQSIYRDYIVVGVVNHVSGSVVGTVLRPAIFGDNGYLFRDATSILARILLSGGRPSQGSSPLFLNVEGGTFFSPGGSSNDASSPNIGTFSTQTDIAFFTLAGASTISLTTTQTSPVGNYDPDGTGVVTAIPGGGTNAVIHRLYYLAGSWVWAYGQRIYAGVSTAAANLNLDRALYKASPRIKDATLVAEIIAEKQTTAMGNTATCLLVPRGGFDWNIGSAGSIDEAPIDGTMYGRKDGLWVPAVEADAPNFTEDPAVIKDNPRLILTENPVSAGWSGINIQQLAFDWFNIEATHPDDKVYLRSYNPANGVLRFTATFDLATGAWTFPGEINAASATLTGAINAASAAITGTATADTVTATTKVSAPSVETTNLKASSLNGGPFGRRNLLINGGFDIWQRGVSFPGVTSSFYTADRWVANAQDGTMTVTRQQFGLGQTAVPGNPTFYIDCSVGAAGTGVKNLAQRVEGVAKYSGTKVTLSFWARTDTGTAAFDISFFQFFGTGGSPSATVETQAGSVQLTDTFQKFTITATLPSVSGKTLGTAGNDYLTASIRWPVGGTRSLRLSNVQLEEGEVATDFDRLPVADTLALCQRYFGAYGGAQVHNSYANAAAINIVRNFHFPCTMRTTPTITTSSIVHNNSNSLSTNTIRTYCVYFQVFSSAEGSSFVTFDYTADAEL